MTPNFSYGDLKIFSGRAHPALAREICDYLGLALGEITLFNFSDGETYCQIDENVRVGERWGQSCVAVLLSHSATVANGGESCRLYVIGRSEIVRSARLIEEALRRQALFLQPDWPSEEERKEGLETQARVSAP